VSTNHTATIDKLYDNGVRPRCAGAGLTLNNRSRSVSTRSQQTRPRRPDSQKRVLTPANEESPVPRSLIDFYSTTGPVRGANPFDALCLYAGTLMAGGQGMVRGRYAGNSHGGHDSLLNRMHGSALLHMGVRRTPSDTTRGMRAKISGALPPRTHGREDRSPRLLSARNNPPRRNETPARSLRRLVPKAWSQATEDITWLEECVLS